MNERPTYEDILFIQMGGTIDKNYPSTETNHGYNFEIGEPASNRILSRALPNESGWQGWVACRKDSLDLGDRDRALVAQFIKASKSSLFVITHGTDTIRLTAEILNGYRLNRTIVLTGSMQPELFRDSDADFNLGMAVAAVMLLPPGVYIALHAAVVPWEVFSPH